MKKLGYGKPYQAFFKKRLQTQSFLQSQIDNIGLSTKILNSLKNAKKQSRVTQQKFNEVRKRQKTKQRQQSQSRQSLRQKLQSRMRLSQANLQKLKSQRSKATSSRSQFEQKTKRKIQQRQKRQLQRSLLKSKDYQTKTETFFKEEKRKKVQEFKRIQNLSPVQRYENAELYNSNSSLLSESKASRFSSFQKKKQSVYKINDNDIRKKQQKKKFLETEKEKKYLEQHLHKMQEIQKIKKKITAFPHKVPISTLPKVISQEREGLKLRSSKVTPRRYNHEVKFSDLYERKLSEKRSRKQEYHSVIVSQSDKIMEKQHDQKLRLKQNKLVKDTLNEYKRWSNYIIREG